MDKRKLIFGAIVGIAIGAVVLSLASVGGKASTNEQCEGNCLNPNCAAAQGGDCDCGECPQDQCTYGQCEGVCEEPTCGAKVGKSCGCGS